MRGYHVPLEEIVRLIREKGAKRVLVQLPDGLKPAAELIQERVKEELPLVELFFWGGSAFGSCDTPATVDRLGFDLLIHLGHEEWR